MREERERIIREIERIGDYITSKDLLRILKAVPERSVEYALRNYRRQKTKKRDKIEKYVESFIENQVVQRGKIPTYREVKRIVIHYFDIPVKDGKIPKRVEDKIKKAYDRARLRYYYHLKKEKRQEALDGLEIAYNQYLEYGKEDKDILYSGYKNALPYLTKEEKEKWKKILMEEGLPEWIL